MKTGLYICVVISIILAINELAWISKTSLAIVLLILCGITGYIAFCLARLMDRMDK